MLLLCWRVCSLTYSTVYLPPLLLPTDQNLKPLFQSSGLPQPGLYCCGGVVVYAHTKISFSFQAHLPQTQLPPVLSPTLAHPAPTLTKGVVHLFISSIALQHLSIWALLRYSWPIIQAHSVFKSGTDLMNHLAQMNRSSPREVKWFIPVYAAVGSQSEMAFLTMPKNTSAAITLT